MHAIPGDCSHYIQCANGIPYKKQCPIGTYFESSSKTCGYLRETCDASDLNDIARVRVTGKLTRFN